MIQRTCGDNSEVVLEAARGGHGLEEEADRGRRSASLPPPTQAGAGLSAGFGGNRVVGVGRGWDLYGEREERRRTGT